MVEADQQEGGDRGQLPIDEERDDIIRQHHPQHRRHEQQDVGEESPLMLVPLQIAAGIKHDEEADAGNQHGKDEAETVDVEIRADTDAWHPRHGKQETPARGNARHQIRSGRRFAEIAGKMQEDEGRRQRQDITGLVAEPAVQHGRKSRGHNGRGQRQIEEDWRGRSNHRRCSSPRKRRAESPESPRVCVHRG